MRDLRVEMVVERSAAAGNATEGGGLWGKGLC